MSRRFLFSMKAPPRVQDALKSLAAADMVICASAIVVVTDDDAVAALLDKLDTAERIVGAEDLEHESHESQRKLRKERDGGSDAAVFETKGKKDKRQYKYTGPIVECPKCHNKVSKMFMLKDGNQCKICSMKAKKLAKSQAAVKSQADEKPDGQWTSAMPQSDGHHQEHLAELQIRPKEKINLDKLSGVRLG